MKFLSKLFQNLENQKTVCDKLATDLNCLSKELSQCRKRIAERNRFYATLPIGCEEEMKLPRNQWAYFLKGKVGIKYVGENLTSSVTYVKTREKVKIPRIIDSERSHKLYVISGYVIDRTTNLTYSEGESISFLRGEPMSLTIYGYVRMTWTPPLPGSTLPFFHSNHASNS